MLIGRRGNDGAAYSQTKDGMIIRQMFRRDDVIESVWLIQKRRLIMGRRIFQATRIYVGENTNLQSIRCGFMGHFMHLKMHAQLYVQLYECTSVYMCVCLCVCQYVACLLVYASCLFVLPISMSGYQQCMCMCLDSCVATEMRIYRLFVCLFAYFFIFLYAYMNCILSLCVSVTFLCVCVTFHTLFALSAQAYVSFECACVYVYQSVCVSSCIIL